jgi:hypothetical protein
MSRKVRWTAIGALLGLAYAYFTIEPLDERMLVVISNNIGFLIGAIFGGMLWGIVLATIVDFFANRKKN